MSRRIKSGVTNRNYAVGIAVLLIIVVGLFFIFRQQALSPVDDSAPAQSAQEELPANPAGDEIEIPQDKVEVIEEVISAPTEKASVVSHEAFLLEGGSYRCTVVTPQGDWNFLIKDQNVKASSNAGEIILAGDMQYIKSGSATEWKEAPRPERTILDVALEADAGDISCESGVSIDDSEVSVPN